MTDQRVTVDAAGCLGRVLTGIGVIWGTIAVLASLGVLNRAGFGGGFLATALGSLFPAVLLLAAGRALRKRSQAVRPVGTPVGDVEKRVPSSRPVPAQRAPIPAPIPDPLPSPPPQQKPAPRPVEPVADEPLPVPPPAPATTTSSPSTPTPAPRPSTRSAVESTGELRSSREMIEDAKKRWGRQDRA